MRIAWKILDEKPELSLGLTEHAIHSNYFCAPAWDLLMVHLDRGTLDPAGGLAWGNIMAKYLKDHPDLTLTCLNRLLACIPEDDTKKRQGFYNKVVKLYGKRPDRQIDLRYRQGMELLKSGEDRKAFTLFLTACADHGKEGRILLPIVERAVHLAVKLKAERQASPFLKKMVSIFPQVRSNRITRTFQELVRYIYPVLEAGGEEEEAARLRKRAGV